MRIGRHRLALALTALAFASITAPVSAEGREDVPVNFVTTGPGSQFYGYTAPVVVTEKGGSVTYVNLDVVRHDFVQDVAVDGVAGPSKKPWCKTYRKGKCPVFWTPSIGLSQETDVLGLESVKPGKSYSFLCTLHPGMKGTLVVRP